MESGRAPSQKKRWYMFTKVLYRIPSDQKWPKTVWRVSMIFHWLFPDSTPFFYYRKFWGGESKIPISKFSMHELNIVREKILVGSQWKIFLYSSPWKKEPLCHWKNVISKYLVAERRKIAENRASRKYVGEPFIFQWINNGWWWWWHI